MYITLVGLCHNILTSYKNLRFFVIIQDYYPNYSRLPITLPTGYLSAGKTTLLNTLLRTPPPRQKIAIIVNNFREENFDHSMIETVEEKPFANNRVAFAVPYGAVWRE